MQTKPKMRSSETAKVQRRGVLPAEHRAPMQSSCAALPLKDSKT